MGIARVDRPDAGGEPAPIHRMSDGEGPLLLALLAGSWILALAVGWVAWRLLAI